MADETTQLQEKIEIKTKGGNAYSLPVAVLALILPVVSQIVVSCNTGTGELKGKLDQQTLDIRELKDQVRQAAEEQRNALDKQNKDDQDFDNRITVVEAKVKGVGK